MINIQSKVLLVGTGNIARDYVKVLEGLDKEFTVVGRSEEGCKVFSEEMQVKAFSGGIKKNKQLLDGHNAAILAIDASELSDVACYLMDNGIRKILVEKPGGLDRTNISYMVKKAKYTNSEVYIAYNRRFYESVLRAEKIIKDDGGVKSFHFEFTEWPHKIIETGLPEETVKNWFICNSTHVIDLAFFLGGNPVDIACFNARKANWTDEYICYAGAGVSDKEALFDYCANWGAPGRWNLEFMTDKHRLIFRPIERLKIQQLKTIEIKEDDKADYLLDTKYKPGLYRQVKAFLEKDKENLHRMKTAREQLDMWSVFEKISGR